ncbi:MAG TPA: response regulator [Patescibacteria group bacterium]|nr:response regulator [Gammaproteobacteria bacterium]HWA51534.1 response regulator [Patescibacteria group bacterium]
MIKVLLVDDHELVRTSIKLLLGDVENIVVTGEAKSGEDAIRLVRELDPDVILMDLNMPGMGGFEAVMRLLRNKPTPKILILSAYTTGLVPARLLNLGVTGYLSKHAKREDMIHAIQTVYSGNRYIDPLIADSIASFHATSKNNLSSVVQLTDRELQMLILIANGMDRTDIAKSLYLSKKTTNGYISGALKKLGAKTDAEAIRIAIQSGLVKIDS